MENSFTKFVSTNWLVENMMFYSSSSSEFRLGNSFLFIVNRQVSVRNGFGNFSLQSRCFCQKRFKRIFQNDAIKPVCVKLNSFPSRNLTFWWEISVWFIYFRNGEICTILFPLNRAQNHSVQSSCRNVCNLFITLCIINCNLHWTTPKCLKLNGISSNAGMHDDE